MRYNELRITNNELRITNKIILLENTFYTVLSLRMEIMHFLKRSGYETIVLSTGPQEDIEKLEIQGFKSHDVGSVVMNPIKAFSYCTKLIWYIHELTPHAIVSFTIRPNIFGSIVARMLNYPIISNVTGTGPLTEDDSMLYRVIRELYKFAFTKNKTVFFQNQDDLEYFLRNQYVSENQAKLLPGSGVDTHYFHPREKLSKNFSFLMISRLIRDKGVMEYVEAAKKVKTIYPDIEFKMLGPFWTQSIGKNTVSKSEMDMWVHDETINYLGYSLDIRPYIADSDCIVLPSYREGCANVLMQGASMGRPLIATDVTGCRNLIEDKKTGLLCEVRNASDLAEKMIEIYRLSESERIEMGQRGRQKMEREYQKSIVLEAYKGELDSII